MFEIYNFSQTEIFAFVLVLIRISVFLAVLPFFGMGTVPGVIKILFSLAIAVLLFPIIQWRSIDKNDVDSYLFWLAGREALIGLFMGGVVRMFFFVFEIGGQLISDSMGLGNAQILNPAFPSHASVVEQFMFLIMVLFFFSINGHHLFLTGLAESYKLVPLSLKGISFDGLQAVGAIVQRIVEVGIKIASPVLVSVFFINIAMAIVGRAVPQINVLVTSIPITVFAGILVISVALPMYLITTERVVDEAVVEVFKLLKTF